MIDCGTRLPIAAARRPIALSIPATVAASSIPATVLSPRLISLVHRRLAIVSYCFTVETELAREEGCGRYGISDQFRDSPL